MSLQEKNDLVCNKLALHLRRITIILLCIIAVQSVKIFILYFEGILATCDINHAFCVWSAAIQEELR